MAKAAGKCWMIKAPRGWLYYSMAGYTRRGVQSEFSKQWAPAKPATWRQLYRKGWRAVRVTISEI